MELLKLELGMDIVHVPYKTAAGAVSDVVGGHVQATIAGVQTAQPQVLTGQLRALAVLSAKRSQAFSDVPTLKEQGLFCRSWKSRPGTVRSRPRERPPASSRGSTPT